jgi:hypothetical protein
VLEIMDIHAAMQMHEWTRPFMGGWPEARTVFVENKVETGELKAVVEIRGNKAITLLLSIRAPKFREIEKCTVPRKPLGA